VDHEFVTFGGFATLQTRGDIDLWELVLNAHPELKGIVELGTWQGGFARYLGAQAESRGMSFTTFDNIVPDRMPPGYEYVNLLEPTAPGLVRSKLPVPGILLCDDGDKPREVQVFAPLLQPGELLVVHDWGEEIVDDDVPYELLERIHWEEAEDLNAMSRVFVRVER
jgi:cephalosporin hydroxylase